MFPLNSESSIFISPVSEEQTAPYCIFSWPLTQSCDKSGTPIHVGIDRTPNPTVMCVFWPACVHVLKHMYVHVRVCKLTKEMAS